MKDISFKLTIGDGGVIGYNEFDLYGDIYKVNDNIARLDGQNTIDTWHDSDDGPPELINQEEQNRRFQAEMTIAGETKQAVLFAINELKRHIHGKQSTAYQAYRNKTQPSVYFWIKLDDTVVWTKFEIFEGWLDDGGSFYTTGADVSAVAYKSILTLWAVPAGRGETITLRNDLPSSPHMIEDSNSDGLADGWNIRASATTTINTSYYLTGGKSMRVNATAAVFSGVDISTGAVTPALGSSLSATVCVFVGIGTARVSLRDGADTAIQTKTVSEANALRSHIGPLSSIWYEIHLSGVSAAAGAKISIDSTDGTGIFYVDNAYLQSGTTAAPKAWCSSSSLKNRYDPTSTSAATRQQINYLDVWGVPGDLPALADITMSNSGTGFARRFRWDRWVDGVHNAANLDYWVDSSEFTGTIGTWTSGTGTSNNHFIRSNGDYGIASATVSADIFDYQVTVLGICRTSDASIGSYIRLATSETASGGVVLAQTETKQLSDANAWQIVEYGVINVADVLKGGSAVVELLPKTTGGNTFDLDALFLLPLPQSSYSITTVNKYAGAPLTIHSVYTEAVNKTVRNSADDLLQDTAGGMWYLIPQKMNRIVFISEDTDGDFYLTIDSTVSLSITPQASHLLGTSGALVAEQLPA